ncbi:Glycosyl transferases group 1 [Nocardioides terrae]|uniref:Glycosyl transferases group 1 n=1 Tax=Nocardioides terrae TaxID=574651 RepID=A0A1I1J7R0_9ACTN|nr:glycosyltransferase family 4 protein [Nocardioides terrae]SFC44415.1 Glycosyl transferases group 1 [Nocardioides terrae]
MTVLHLVVPHDIDDPARPSGGNRYDRRLADALTARGRRVVEHAVTGDWPHPGAEASARLAATLAAVTDGEAVLVDGLLASASPDVVIPAAARVALGVLVHLPLGVETPAVRAAERAVMRSARSVVVTSSWTGDWLGRQYGLADVHVAPPGVDPAPVAAGTPSGRALLSVGRASHTKGYDVLADALATLTDLPWTCTWVGPHDDLPPGPIALTGPLPPAAVAERYHATDLLVLPSRTESYGMVLAEALARGVPVLASDVGGVREAIGSGLPGLLVPPGDPGTLAGALRRWLTDASLRRDLRSRALARRDTLDGWDVTASRIEAALPTAVGAGS